MFKKITNLSFLIIVISVLFCTTASGTDTKWIGTTIDDQALEHKVKSVLSAQVPSGSYTVVSFNKGSICVSGS